MKYNIITHITTACNYDCSYCDVIKDKKVMSSQQRGDTIIFIEKNFKSIERFKFFGGEPLLAFRDIKEIIDATHQYIGYNYEIVTNTTMLTDRVGEYLEKYFSHIFFSIDSENEFKHDTIVDFVNTYNLENKLYFNLVISPEKEDIALKQFQRLYDSGMRGFNILPVYFTQAWQKQNLQKLSEIMKYILDLSLKDTSLRLYGFMENSGYDTSLANNTIFVDIDGKIYYSDIVSTFSGSTLKEDLYLGEVSKYELSSLEGYDFDTERKSIHSLEEKIYNIVGGQKQLHKIMDYFSHYLTQKQ